MIRMAQYEKIRIWYEAKRLTTGLTDITIDIYDSAGNKKVDGANMTELGSGHYYYDFKTNGTGNFFAVMDSASQQSRQTENISVFGRNTPFGQALRSTGGPVKVHPPPIVWSKVEKDKFLEEFKEFKSQVELHKSILDRILKFMEQRANQPVSKFNASELEEKMVKITEKINILKIPEYSNEIRELKEELSELKSDFFKLAEIRIKSEPSEALEESYAR